MPPHQLYSIKNELIKWGYPRRLVEKMKPKRLLKCYQDEKDFQEYQNIKENEYYLAQLLKFQGRPHNRRTSYAHASLTYLRCLHLRQVCHPSRQSNEGDSGEEQ